MNAQTGKNRATGSLPVAATCLGLFLTGAIPAAQDSWPQIRGANGDGVATNVDPPLEWSESSNVKWKTAVPARGHSSPVVRDGRIYLATAVEENTREEKIGSNMCFVADSITIKVLAYGLDDGKLFWEQSLFEVKNPAPVHILNSFATPTPVADGKYLYCDFGTYGTACLECETGAVVWKTRLPIDHEVGPGSSPAVYKNLLILVRDGRDAQYVTALDKMTGKESWRTKRPLITGSRTEMHKAFATPVFVESGDSTQVVIPGAQWLVSYDPASGRELWRCSHGKGFSIAPQPAIGNGLVIYCTGFFGNHIRAVKHDGSGDVSDSHVAWKCSRWMPTIPSPVLVGNELYWVADSGTACCADASSGEIIWLKNLRSKFRASPIHAAGRLYLFDTTGKCHVLKSGREFELLQTNQLDNQEVTATPAFVNSSIVLRTHTHLYRIDKTASSK
jgi:outer membrane protein assembly factor BamB